MGANESSSSSRNRTTLDKNEVDRLLQQQKALYDQKYAELVRIAKSQQQNNAAAQQTAREEARKEVEKLMKEKQEQLLRQNAQLNDTPPVKTAGAQARLRSRSPYTCAGSTLTSPTVTNAGPSPVQKTVPITTLTGIVNVNNAAPRRNKAASSIVNSRRSDTLQAETDLIDLNKRIALYLAWKTTDARENSAMNLARNTTDARENSAMNLARNTTEARESSEMNFAKSTAIARKSNATNLTRSTTDARESRATNLARTTTDARESSATNLPRSTTGVRESSATNLARNNNDPPENSAMYLPMSTTGARERSVVNLARNITDAGESTATNFARNATEALKLKARESSAANLAKSITDARESSATNLARNTTEARESSAMILGKSTTEARESSSTKLPRNTNDAHESSETNLASNATEALKLKARENTEARETSAMNLANSITDARESSAINLARSTTIARERSATNLARNTTEARESSETNFARNNNDLENFARNATEALKHELKARENTEARENSAMNITSATAALTTGKISAVRTSPAERESSRENNYQAKWPQNVCDLERKRRKVPNTNKVSAATTRAKAERDSAVRTSPIERESSQENNDQANRPQNVCDLERKATNMARSNPDSAVPSTNRVSAATTRAMAEPGRENNENVIWPQCVSDFERRATNSARSIDAAALTTPKGPPAMASPTEPERQQEKPVHSYVCFNRQHLAALNAETSAFPHASKTLKTEYPFNVQSSDAASTTQPPVPSEPQARFNPRNSANDDLNCPTCKNRYNGNIYQCIMGHSSCSLCKVNSRVCGHWVGFPPRVCGQPITEMRNSTLEAYVSERQVQCPNSDQGCKLVIKLADMEVHTNQCPFREMMCPLRPIFGQCNWSGKLPNLAAHFDIAHQMHRQADVDTEMVMLKQNFDNQIVYLVVIRTLNFLFHAKVSEQEQKLYIAVMLVGTEHSATKWCYEIQIYNKREPRRKFQYVDVCHSASKSIDELISESECAAIPLSYADTFMNGGFFTYKFYIRNEERNIFGNDRRGRGGMARGAGRGAPRGMRRRAV